MSIRITGAREHNLVGFDLTLPSGKLIVFCGRSGSGKSSLAFDTLHAEGQRRYLQALGLSSQAELQPPDVDRIEGLPPTLALSQHQRMPGAFETVGTVSGVAMSLRLLFGRAGVLHCPQCGRAIEPRTPDGIVADLYRFPEGARVTLEAPVRGGLDVLEELERAGFSRVRWQGQVERIEELRMGTMTGDGELRVVLDRVKLQADRRGRLTESVRLAGTVGHGVVVAMVDDQEVRWVDRPYCPHDDLNLPPLEPRLLSHRSGAGRCLECGGLGCDVCDGTRLSVVARRVQWRGHTVDALRGLTFATLRTLCTETEATTVETAILGDLVQRLDGLVELGLGSLCDRDSAQECSSGALQRMRLARTVAAALGGVLYVLDEPTAGLGPGEAEAVLRVLRRLVDGGSTVLVVEHEKSLILGSDHLVEFGPGAGEEGGRVVFEGSPKAFVASDTLTARWVTGAEALLPSSNRPQTGTFVVDGDVVGMGQLVVVSGPSGSGKSRWLRALAKEVTEGRSPFERVIVADRAAGRNKRSMPATYVGLWDVMRGLLAQTKEATVRGLTAAAFSLNAKGGRCEACKGHGVERVALDMLADVVVPCGVCDGRRYSSDVLNVRWRGLNASELLLSDAHHLRPLLSGHPKLANGLSALTRVGLGYVPLGQSTESLSGGEARRLALARELTRPVTNSVYVLDGPTVGLHPADTAVLMEVLVELVEQGASVFVATHDPGVTAMADHVVHVHNRP